MIDGKPLTVMHLFRLAWRPGGPFFDEELERAALVTAGEIDALVLEAATRRTVLPAQPDGARPSASDDVDDLDDLLDLLARVVDNGLLHEDWLIYARYRADMARPTTKGNRDGE